jgi:hypothetical protein
MLDNTIKHSGKASLKITGLEKLPASARGEVRVGQALKVKPFHNYILSAWVKSENLQAEAEDFVLLFSGNRQRRHSYTNLRVATNQDWTRHSIIFNSLEADTIDFSVGVTDARRGAIWFDDIAIVPAGKSHHHELEWHGERPAEPAVVCRPRTQAGDRRVLRQRTEA